MNDIRVIVVDDSAFMRKIISDIINEENGMRVVAVARNGLDLLNKLEKVHCDVITLDIEMSVMDGLTILKKLKEDGIDIPVIVISGLTNRSIDLTLKCLKNGAVDFLPKPSGTISLNMENVKTDLINKIKIAYSSHKTKKSKRYMRNKSDVAIKLTNKIEAVVIGASTGGPKALYEIITKLPCDLNVPVFVVQHMPQGFTYAFANRLDSNSMLTVVEAYDNQVIKNNVVYIAPGGYHMLIGQDKKIHLSLDKPLWGVRPSVDVLFKSASDVYGSKLVSVVLTGMGRDGAEGTAYIKNNGGITISEDKSTCVIYGMPKCALETGKIDLVLPLYDIKDEIIKLVKEAKV